MNPSHSMHPTAYARIFFQAFSNGLRGCAVNLATIAFALFVVFALAPAAGAQTTPPEFLFVGQSVPGQSGNVPGIATYTVNTTTGALAPIAAAPVQTRGQGTGALAINLAGTELFGTTTNSAGQGAVEVFNIASDGSLTEVANSPFGIGQAQALLQLIAVSPNGNFLYAASEMPGDETTPQSTIVQVFAIAADGSLTLNNTFAYAAVEACDPSNPAPLTPVQFFLHPTQKWLYLFMGSSFGPPCSGQPSEVQPFVINSDGTLTPGTLNILPLYATLGYGLTGSPDGTLLFLMTKQSPNDAIIYSGGIDRTTGDVGFEVAYSYPELSPEPNLSLGALAIDSTSTYLYSSAGTFSIQDGAITLIDSTTNPFLSGGSILASSTTPLIFGPAPTVGNTFIAALVNSDGSLTPAPGSPFAIALDGFGAMVLSRPTPIPDKAVMWIIPDGPIDFSAVQVGQTGTNSTAIENVGWGPLTITSIAVTGDPSLSVTNTCSSPVAPAGTCSAVVNFTPTTVGTFTGMLTIETNVATRTFAISASSVAPPPPAPDPILNAPNPILFPDTATGSSSPLTFQLQNGAKATASLVVSSITIGGSNPGDFSQTNTCMSAPIPAGSSCSVTITFSPQAVGGRAATLNVNGPSGGLVGATLSGNGATTVTKFSFAVTASGPGTVAQTPTGTSLANNTTITLNATPNANSFFVSWGGVCPGTVQPTCSFVLNSNTTATANFVTNISFNVVAVGPGTVMQSPPGTSFAPGTSITLTAVPNEGATFTSWAGPCAGSPNPLCTFAISANTTATFAGDAQVTLATSVVGPGAIQQSPTGTSFASGTSITLTAVPNTGATFTSWAGACAGSTNAVCTFAIAANTSATATFAAGPTVTPSQPSQMGAAGTAFTFPISTSGFAAPPTLTASCSIPDGTCTISGTTLTVTTTARTAGAARVEASFPAAPGASSPWAAGLAKLREMPKTFPPVRWPLLGLVMLLAMHTVGASPRARRMLRPVSLVAALFLIWGCGGGSTPPPVNGTPAGTYTVTIMAKAGTQTAMTTVNVVVQ